MCLSRPLLFCCLLLLSFRPFFLLSADPLCYYSTQPLSLRKASASRQRQTAQGADVNLHTASGCCKRHGRPMERVAVGRVGRIGEGEKSRSGSVESGACGRIKGLVLARRKGQVLDSPPRPETARQSSNSQRQRRTPHSSCRPQAPALVSAMAANDRTAGDRQLRASAEDAATFAAGAMSDDVWSQGTGSRGRCGIEAADSLESRPGLPQMPCLVRRASPVRHFRLAAHSPQDDGPRQALCDCATVVL